jgi:uncharacterized protein
MKRTSRFAIGGEFRAIRKRPNGLVPEGQSEMAKVPEDRIQIAPALEAPPVHVVTCFLQFSKYTTVMKNDVLPVEIRGILPANSGCAIFVGNEEKVFVIQVEHNMGAVIGMFLRDTPKERPLTHDLMNNVLKGFGVTIERVVITELKNSTYFARLILKQDNELGQKIVEIDARPSDCLALATAQKRPIFVRSALFEQVEDMTEVLERINENSGESE